MSYFSQFAGGPAKVTQYTTGTGNYAPISTNLSWARVTVVGGGAGGQGGYTSNGGGAGGGAGATRIAWIKLNESSYAYSVGAGGNGGAAGSFGEQGNDGSRSWFGSIMASPGIAASNNTSPYGGGTTQAATITANIVTYAFLSGETAGGSGGGAGNSEYAGKMFGFPNAFGNGPLNQANATIQGRASSGGSGNNGAGGAGGGDSMYGIGGTGGAGNGAAGGAASGYGGGGGGGGQNVNSIGAAGGAGKGGLIIIEEFVQS